MSQSRLAYITFIDGGGGNYPDQGLPGGGYPSQGLPGYQPPVDPGYGRPGYGGGRPDQSLPGYGHISLLPVFPFDPTIDNSLPGSGGRPDQSLPGSGARPDQGLPRPIVPGAKFVAKWLACQGLILVPDQSLPETPEPKEEDV